MTRTRKFSPPIALALLGLFLGSFAATEANAQAPPPLTIDFQARLTDNLGDPLVGAVQLTLSIYDVATGGVALWQEVHNTTALAGVVNLRLGSITTMPVTLFELGTLYLGVKVGTDPEMTPRRQLASVPFSMRSSRVERIDTSTAIDPNVIAGAHIQGNAIDTSRIADGEVRNADIALDAIDTGRIADGEVRNADIALDAIDTSRIADGEVRNADIALDAIDTSRIADGEVRNADIALDAIDTSRIADGEVRNSDIALNAVDSTRILDGGVIRDDLALDAVDSTRIQDGSVIRDDLALDAVDSTRIQDGSVIRDDLALDSVDSTRIQDGTVALADLDPTGAVSGQVIKFDGLNLSWATDDSGTLNLPYSGNVATIGPAFAVVQMDSGSGIQGLMGNPAALASHGVVGTTMGISGSAGVYGDATDPWNPTYGVYGRTDSASEEARGVFGTGPVNGVEGESTAVTPSGDVVGHLGFYDLSFGEVHGVRGTARYSSGKVHGVSGQADALNSSVSAIGVAGSATGSVSYNSGVYGTADGTNLSFAEAIGVHGEATGDFDSGKVYGLKGSADAPGANMAVYGVYGAALSGDAFNYGVMGEAWGLGNADVYGVIGRAHDQGGPGARIGVYGKGGDYGVFSLGDFGGTGAKYFVQPHPTDPSREIRFVSLEGPESGTYFRGSSDLVGGRAIIEVPESFRLASEAEGMTVQVTAVGAPALLWIESQDLQRIVVRGEPDVAFHYFVNGVRRGFAGFEPMRENRAYVPEVQGVPYGAEYRPDHRRILVENGILNADFTPNEDTAAALGWRLRDPTEEDLGDVPASEGQ